MSTEDISDFVALISAFVDGEIDANAFETQYLELWNANLDMKFPDAAYGPLETVFFDVDAYVGDPEIRDEDDLDEEQLKASARSALHSLRRSGGDE